jgi:hypothetical protein
VIKVVRVCQASQFFAQRGCKNGQLAPGTQQKVGFARSKEATADHQRARSFYIQEYG